MSQHVIALDQGTTSSRTIIFDVNGKVVSLSQHPFAQIYPQPGWVEHDPMTILYTQLESLSEAFRTSGLSAADIAAVGITNQRETTIVWEKETGRPVYNAIVWQCRRTAPLCEELRADGWEEKIREKTGLLIDAYFSGTKLRWILDNVPGARERAERGELLFGTVDTWLIWNLTGGHVHVTDYSNEEYGTIDSHMPGLEELSGTPICGAAGDQQAALLGQGCIHPGEAKNTYGTGCFAMMNTGPTVPVSRSGLLSCVAWSIRGETNYCLEGSVFNAGSTVQWMRDELHLISSAEETQALAESVPDNGGVYLVSAFTGLGAPYWDMYARGTLVGITRGTTRAHVVRAGLEGIAYQVRDLIDAMEKDAGAPMQILRVDGGASVNRFLMQFQADVLRCPIDRPVMVETTALGAAFLAGLHAGVWSNVGDIVRIRESAHIFRPKMDAESAQELCRRWHKAVERAKDWE